MQELERILKEIDQEVEEYMEIDFGDEYNAGIKDMAKMAKKIIRKHMNDGWVSVEERVPKEEGYKVLVCSKKGNIDTGIYSPYTKQWFIGNISALGKDIIAWRPLPEPYRPERSVEE